MKLSGALIGALTKIPTLAKAGDFQLHRVPLVRAGCPAPLSNIQANKITAMPIVIAKNREKYGFVASTNYYPKAVIVAGAERRARMLANCMVAGWAWIEAGALDINADDAMSSQELSNKLTQLLMTKHVGRCYGITCQETPWIVELYPFENYCVYNFRAQTYRQPYAMDNASRSVALLGEPQKVAQQFENVTACIEVMPRSQTGARYAFAPVKGNQQTSTMGALNSELYTQIVRDWTNINEAASMYVNAIEHGLYKPMVPAFHPVVLPANGRITQALASKGIPIADFAIWSEEAKAQNYKVRDGVKIPRSKWGYVGDPKDPSTWKLPLNTPGRKRNALNRINQTHDIPSDKKAGVLNKVRKTAKKGGVEVSDKPTSKQRGWMHRSKAMGDSATMGY